MLGDVDEDVNAWILCRVSRYYWLAHMSSVIDSVKSAGSSGIEVHSFFKNHFSVLKVLKDRLAEGSCCFKDCKSFCCYFSKDPYSQIAMTRSEFKALEEIVSKSKGVFQDYYSFIPLDKVNESLKEYLEKSPEFFFDVDGVKMICLMNPSDRFIDQTLLWDLPFSVKKFRRLWADRNSCACRFLGSDGKCSIYTDIRLAICREFFCLPALTAVVLIHLGLADDRIMNLSLRDLNLLSTNVARVFREGGFLDLEKDFDSKFRELAIAFVNGKDVEIRFNELKNFENDYESTLKARLSMKLNV